jgi:outer membrane lipoprotein SlyB
MHEPDQSIESTPNQPESPTHHPIATGVGAAGGSAAGAAIGNAIAGKMGAAVGSVAGAIAGGMAGGAIAEFTEEVLQETKPSLSLGLGADTKEPELPAHYTWEDLQALSKPQTNGV